MASDYRSHQVPSVPNVQKPNSGRSTSYAAVTRNDSFPKKDQGIILECKDGLEITHYTCAIGNIVQPKNVLFSSKISNNRFCLFLSSKELVQEITSNRDSLKINDQIIKIRPLITNHLRIILSNVSPTIPHAIVEDELDNLGIRRGSSVTFLKASITAEGYNHVLSFRRQVYIHPEDMAKLPEILKINYDESLFHIYPTNDVVKCFLCKQEGHIAKNCKTPEILNGINSQARNRQSDNLTTAIYADVIPTQEPHTKGINTNNSITDEATQLEINQTESTQTGIKRARSTSLSTTASKEPPSKQDTMFTTPTIKIGKKKLKMKEDNNKSIDVMLEPLIPLLRDRKKLLNFNQLKSLLENTLGESDQIGIIQEYTNDIGELSTFLKNDVYPNLKDRSIKARITRLTNKINKIDTTPNVTPCTSDDEK